MAELLFEILSEEIPARMQDKAAADLQRLMSEGLEKAGLKVSEARVLSGPRRLTYVADIPVSSPDVREERKGPRVGAPEQALGGFMKAAGLSDISQAEVRADKKGDIYVAIIERSGRAAGDILSELIPAIMDSFPWPKSMKSGGSSFRWVRPLRGLLILLDGKVVDVEVGGIQSSNVTNGHRRHGAGPYKVKNFADYKVQLEGAGHVILSREARKALIAEQAIKLCADKGLELIEDEGLLNEVAGLAEWPVVILGDMDPAFLELPAEVIRLSMRSHQKYFAVRDPKTGALAPHFIVVANQAAPDGGKAIAAGNSRVLSARLSDAVFFQSEDAKQNLEAYYDKLDTVVFHKKLGSVRDKAERVAALAGKIAPQLGADAKKAKQAAKLAKCDLVTQTVIEFTSLQGQIGRLIYEREGGDATIALAIEDHYKPQGPSDKVPTDPVAVAVALADKIDTLVGFWAIDEKPTGSKDPFALRRAALGVVRIILDNDNKVRVCLKQTISEHLEEQFDFIDPVNAELRDGREYNPLVVADLLSFIADRLKVYLRDQGVAHDLIDAVFALGEDDLVTIVARVEALQGFLNTEDGENLLAGYRRAANILKAEGKKGDLPSGAPKRPQTKEGAELYDALQAVAPEIKAALQREEYAVGMLALAKLRAPIDSFFTEVQVIVDNAEERDNNLRLLGLIRDTARQIANFEVIQR